MAAFNPNLADDKNREDDVTRWRTGVGPEPDVDGTEMTASKQLFAGGFKQLHDPRPDHIPAM
jgi:hypothetical protein